MTAVLQRLAGDTRSEDSQQVDKDTLAVESVTLFLDVLSKPKVRNSEQG